MSADQNPHEPYRGLYEYLIRLSEDLKSRGQHELAAEVKFASRFVVGSPSEFLHEAQQALKRVKSKCGSTLSRVEAASITDMIQKIEISFLKIGGA